MGFGFYTNRVLNWLRSRDKLFPFWAGPFRTKKAIWDERDPFEDTSCKTWQKWVPVFGWKRGHMSRCHRTRAFARKRAWIELYCQKRNVKWNTSLLCWWTAAKQKIDKCKIWIEERFSWMCTTKTSKIWWTHKRKLKFGFYDGSM